MAKLITAEEARILNETRESLHKVYNIINQMIREAALDGKYEIDYLLSPYLYKNYKVLTGILRDSLTAVGYHVEIANRRSPDNMQSIDKVTLNISWLEATNTEVKNESETEE